METTYIRCPKPVSMCRFDTGERKGFVMKFDDGSSTELTEQNTTPLPIYNAFALLITKRMFTSTRSARNLMEHCLDVGENYV